MHLLKFYEIIQFFDRHLKDFFLFALQAPEGRNLLQNMLNIRVTNQCVKKNIWVYRKLLQYVQLYI